VFWASAGLALVLSHPTRAQDPTTTTAPQVTEDEVVERLLELQEEIERLLPYLAPELRREIARRLAERAAAQERQAEAAAGAAKAPSTEPPEPPKPAESPGGPESPKPTPSTPSTPSTQPTETPEPTPPRIASPRCNTLDLLDTQEDSYIDAGDRYWRYLYLWTDGNGNGEVEPREVRSAFDAGVRRISVRLDRFEGKDDTVGLIRIGRWIVLDPGGGGFSGGITGATDDGALTVDAGSLGRFSGPKLLGPDGEPLEGMQPFRPGLRMRDEEGQVVVLTCPR